MSLQLRNNNGKLPILVMVVMAVVIVALVGTGVMMFTKPKNKSTKGHEEAKPETLMPLQEFIVNLADTTEAHYLKLECTLGITGDAAESSGGHGEDGADPVLTIVRDTIITVVGQYTYTELLTNVGKETLKTKIISELRKSCKTLHVKNVYFTNFAMQ